jgi:hypothetical protein
MFLLFHGESVRLNTVTGVIHALITIIINSSNNTCKVDSDMAVQETSDQFLEKRMRPQLRNASSHA